MRFFALLLGLTAALGQPGLAHAEEDELAPLGGLARRAVLKNGFMQLGPFVTLDADCRLIGEARARVVIRPRHGRLEVLHKRGDVAFSPGHPLARCNNRPAAGTTLLYRPRRDFVGPDTFTYELTFMDGERRRVTYALKIAAP